MNRIAKTAGIIYNSTCCLSAIHPKQMISISERQYLFYKGKIMSNYGPKPKDLSIAIWKRIKIGTKEECWEWQGSKNNKGYGTIGLCAKRYYVHRLAYQFRIGPIPPGMVIMHTCDNPSCCNPEHLKPGTQKDNIQDCKNKNRLAIGNRHGMSKFTPEDIIEIRRLHKEGIMSARTIAELFGTTRHYVFDIVARNKWKHI